MQSVLLVLHVLVVLALIGVILLQRSEGGALGIGGGGPGSMFSARGQANFLTKTTAVLGATFMALSILLAILYGTGGEDALPSFPTDGLPVESPDGGDGVVPLFPTLPESGQ